MTPSSLSLTFRKAAARDIAPITALYNECFAEWTEHPEWTPGYISQLVTNSRWQVVVAEDTPGHLAGFVVANCTYAKSDQYVNIDVMAVDAESRKHGVGRALMHMGEMAARNAGAEKLCLQVVEKNEAAQKLYLSIGFNFVGRSKRYYSDGTDALLMEKQLPENAAANDDQQHPAVQRPTRRRWSFFG